jgi:importin-5
MLASGNLADSDP